MVTALLTNYSFILFPLLVKSYNLEIYFDGCKDVLDERGPICARNDDGSQSRPTGERRPDLILNWRRSSDTGQSEKDERSGPSTDLQYLAF